MNSEIKPSNRHFIAVVLLAFAIFWGGSSHTPVPTVDGAVRSNLARNIIETGKWFPLIYQGVPFNDHPPLYVWSVATCFKFFGINDFAANLPMRLFAFLVVLVTYALARLAGLNRGVALISCIILCTTRDFVLSSARGYVEPLLEFWMYLGLFFILLQLRARTVLPALTAAVCVFGAFFTKGPPALWPLLYFGFILAWNPYKHWGRRILDTCTYFAANLLLGLAFYGLIQRPEIWPHFQNYLHHQVLNSALQGRNGAQAFDPFYFANLLKQYYLPWIIFLPWALWRSLWPSAADRAAIRDGLQIPQWIFVFFAAGIIGGFSIVKWKFWYYIAPAYPALAIAISGTSFFKTFASLWERPYLPRFISAGAIVFVFIVSAIPIKLYKDRVPEISVFAPAITTSGIPGPVWFIHNERDHNMIATSGEWSFHVDAVKKVSAEEESQWSANLSSPSWIITGSDFWKNKENLCKHEWCRKGRLISLAGMSALVLYYK